MREIEFKDATVTISFEEVEDTIEEIPIDYLLHDIIILKAECLRDQKLLGYCEYLEKQLFKIKNGEAKIKV